MNRKIEKQIRKKSKNNRVCLSIFAFVMLLFVPFFVYASETKSDGNTTQVIEEENKTVRVGYFPYANFQEGGYGEHKQGAGYEYLQKISYITGWKYEYVYGSFKECLDMLADGEIDILGNVSYTPERAESIDYSTYAAGTERYWIYTREDHTDLMDGDPKQMNGCRIGVADGSYQKELLEKWLDSNQIQAEVVVCKGYDEMIEKLYADELDALVIPVLSVNSDFIAIANIGASDCYFGVSKSRPDLLKELNATLEEINNTETDYSSKLYASYEGKAVINYALNKEEKQWLDAHENTICVGYLKDNLPFCGEENGKLTGILGTVLDTVQEKYKITITAVPCSTGEQMNEALQSGEIDIAGPIIQDFYTQEQFQVVLLNTIFALVFPGIVTAFGTFLLRQGYMGLPKDLEEAARLDGCNIGQTFLYIMAPLTRSSMVALGIFTAVFAFKDLMWPMIVNTDKDMLVLSSALAKMQGQYVSKFPELMAASLIACIPMIVLYMIFQKQFIEGIATSGGKL